MTTHPISSSDETTPGSPVLRTLRRPDWWIALVLALAAALGTWTMAKRIPLSVTDGTRLDVYFSADCSRVLANMVYRLESDHHRTNVHPLYSILMYPVFHTVAAATGIGAGDLTETERIQRASRVLSALGSGGLFALLFLTLRVASTPRPDAIIHTILGASCAFAIFWFPVPETYLWGSLSIVAALFVCALGCIQQLGIAWYGVASLATFAITTTNWSVGLLASATRYWWRKALILTLVVGFVASCLSIAQKLAFPSSWFYFNIAREKNYVMQEHSGGPTAALRSLLFHTAVMPEITTLPHPRYAGMTILRTQGSSPGGAGWLGKSAAAVWVVLLAGGVAALALDRREGFGPYRITLGLSLAGQVALHLIYGAETFLYTAHYGPMMILTIACLSQTRFRRPAVAAAGVLAVLLFAHNLSAHARAMELIRSL